MAESLDYRQIQGIVASAYMHLPWTAYILLRIDPARTGEAREWLHGLLPSITTCEARDDRSSLNIALTRTGLENLGVSEQALLTFSAPFIDGMASGRRASILGDRDPSAPNDSIPADDWSWGGSKNPVDVLLLVYGKTEPSVGARAAQLEADATSCGLTIVKTLRAQIYPNCREHFGFVDGIGQPVLEGLRKKFDPTLHDRDVVKDGEFVLGYVNEYGYLSETPTLGEPKLKLGRNGTYLVFRETTQDVKAFRAFVDEAARTHGLHPEFLAAKFVGRWKDGAPLVKAPLASNPVFNTANTVNDFGFASEDPDGLRCPLGAHIRRANPRDAARNGQPADPRPRSLRHRLLRRGRSYGTRYDDDLEGKTGARGLNFIALCADIERQFEFVQQTWVNNPAFEGLDEVDPLIGSDPPGDGTNSDPPTFTIQDTPVRRRVKGMRSFVDLKGGAYFFVPSIGALQWLAASTGTPRAAFAPYRAHQQPKPNGATSPSKSNAALLAVHDLPEHGREDELHRQIELPAGTDDGVRA